MCRSPKTNFKFQQKFWHQKKIVAGRDLEVSYKLDGKNKKKAFELMSCYDY